MPFQKSKPAEGPKRLVLQILRFYQRLISPLIHGFLGPTLGCRFVPTCSNYAIEAIHQYGLTQGIFLALKRISRCQPFGRAGYDPIPRDIDSNLSQSER